MVSILYLIYSVYNSIYLKDIFCYCTVKKIHMVTVELVRTSAGPPCVNVSPVLHVGYRWGAVLSAYLNWKTLF